MANPVWNKYILTSMPNWLQWFANNHTKAHVQVFEKFLMANPYYLPDIDFLENSPDTFILSLIYDREFINSLSSKGLQVWYYSDFKDFLNTLRPYASKNKDLMKRKLEGVGDGLTPPGQLFVKQFPTSQATVPDLEAYLKQIEEERKIKLGCVVRILKIF